MENYDSLGFRRYMFKAELDKALHTLEGILKGIAIDNIINMKEFAELEAWYKYHEHFANRHPFSELIPLIGQSLEDGILDNEEVNDILWLCNNLQTRNYYYDVITSDIQRLEGILHGILSDNKITDDEIRALNLWLEDSNHLIKTYPYDEIYSLVVSVLADGTIDEDERKMLKVFFSEFVDIDISRNLDKDEIARLKQEVTISGICSVCPEIVIPNKYFCFTGASSKTTRRGFADIVTSLGGHYNDSVTAKTDYLVIGDNGNPCWAFSCYGRKVEAAARLRKKGHGIVVAHENDFWDALNNFVGSQCS